MEAPGIKGGYGWRAANKDEQAVEFCRDVAQFANTDGGVAIRDYLTPSTFTRDVIPIETAAG